MSQSVNLVSENTDFGLCTRMVASGTNFLGKYLLSRRQCRHWYHRSCSKAARVGQYKTHRNSKHYLRRRDLHRKRVLNRPGIRCLCLRNSLTLRSTTLPVETEMPNSSNLHVSWLIQRARSATLRQYAPGNKELIT